MAGWRRLVCACALEGTPGSSKRVKRGKQEIAAGLKGLRLLWREEIEDSEDDVCQLTSFDVCPVVWMKLQDLSGP